MHGLTRIQALLKALLESDKYIVRLKLEEGTKRLTHLFFAHKKSLTLLAEFPEVVLMDCTYKTNRYRMPLLNIVGTTQLNTTFLISGCFIKGEKEEDYLWALSQWNDVREKFNIPSPGVVLTNADKSILKVLPKTLPNAAHLLCLWHVNKNIGKRMKPYFRKEYKGADNAQERTNFIEAQWKDFLLDWMSVVRSTTELEYKIN